MPFPLAILCLPLTQPKTRIPVSKSLLPYGGAPPWDNIHHRSCYLPQATNPSFSSNQYTIETKYFIPSGHVDWFWNPIPTLDAFEEGNMVNISPSIHINISHTLRVTENINVGESYSPTEVEELKHLFQEFRDIFAMTYKEMLGLDPTIVEHHIDTLPNSPPIHQK